MEGLINLTLYIANETSSDVAEDVNDASSKVLRFKDYPHDALITGFAFLVLVVVFGVLASTISILALVKSSKLNKATTALIVNLCFTDLMFSATSTPFAVTIYWNAGWDCSRGLCVAYGVSRFLYVGTSISTVIWITINRYVIIVKPMLYKRVFTPGNNLLVVAGTWLIPVVVILAPTAGVWGKFAWDEDIGDCSVVPYNGKSSKAFLFMVAYFLPTVFFVVCYSRMYWIVRNTQKNLRQYRTNRKSAAFVANLMKRFAAQQEQEEQSVPEERIQRHQKRTDKDLKLLKMVLIIFTVFTWCYLPGLVIDAFRLLDNYPGIKVVAYLNFQFSGCVNPIIYICMSREYRQAYRELFQRKSTILSTARAATRLPFEDKSLDLE